MFKPRWLRWSSSASKSEKLKKVSATNGSTVETPGSTERDGGRGCTPGPLACRGSPRFVAFVGRNALPRGRCYLRGVRHCLSASSVFRPSSAATRVRARQCGLDSTVNAPFPRFRCRLPALLPDGLPCPHHLRRQACPPAQQYAPQAPHPSSGRPAYSGGPC
jgi:hypothetical protein